MRRLFLAVLVEIMLAGFSSEGRDQTFTERTVPGTSESVGRPLGPRAAIQ